MKRTLVFGAATAVMALSLTGCPLKHDESIEAVYGPPPTEQDDPAKQSTNQKQNTTVDEPVEDVYGPPVDINEPDDDGSGNKTDPEEPIPAVYGPPTDEPVTTVYGPPAS